MHASENQNIVSLFGGERIPAGYRGRRGQRQIGKQAARRIALVLGTLVFGFATAATAITIKKHLSASLQSKVEQALPANLVTVPGTGGFEQAIY